MGKILIERMYPPTSAHHNYIYVEARMIPPGTIREKIEYNLQKDECLFVKNSMEWREEIATHGGTTYFTIIGDQLNVDKFAGYIQNGPPVDSECLNHPNVPEEL